MIPYVFIMGLAGVGKTTLASGLTRYMQDKGIPAQAVYIGAAWRYLASRFPEERDDEALDREIRQMDIRDVSTLENATLSAPGLSMRAAHLSQDKGRFDTITAKVNALLRAEPGRDCSVYVVEGRRLALALLPPPLLAVELVSPKQAGQGSRRKLRDSLDLSRDERWGYRVPDDGIFRLDTGPLSPDQTLHTVVARLRPMSALAG